jgi:hypothetical protein
MHNGLPENACRKFIHGKVPSGQSHSDLNVIKLIELVKQAAIKSKIY